MAVVGLVAMARRRWRATADRPSLAGWKRAAVAAGIAVAAIGLMGLTTFLLTGGVTLRLPAVPPIRIRGIERNLLAIAVGTAAVVTVSPRARAWFQWGLDLRGCAVVLGLLAVVLSWGPSPVGNERSLEFTGPYWWLYKHVPGFDGLRVPARLAMVAYVFLAVAAGYGLAVIDRLRHGARWMALLGALFLVEATGVPIAVGKNFTDPAVGVPESRVWPAADAPEVYRHLATLPPGVVVAELPFGYPSWELRYVFYSSVHHHRLMNGYSGGFPDSYLAAAAALMAPLETPDRAWQALRSAGVTHVVVHRQGLGDARAEEILSWLASRGARPAGRFGPDELVTLPR
jgi:hypothetical protein